MNGPLRGERVMLRPLAEEDAARLREIHVTPEVSAWWGTMADGFPLTDEPETTRLTIELDGEVAGLIQYGEEDEPDYRHAWIDIFVDPDVHSRGVGTDAVRTLAVHLCRDRQHHRLTIDPAVENERAIACYRKVGFRPVGVMRQYERVWWEDGRLRDGLLMDLLAEEL